MNPRNDMTVGPLDGHLKRLAGPMLVGIFAMMAVGITDSYFAGRIGSDALAAIGFIGPVAFGFTSLIIGAAAGASSILSRAIGGGDMGRARSYARDALITAAVLALGMLVIGRFLIGPIFSVAGASASCCTAGFVPNICVEVDPRSKDLLAGPAS